MGFAKYAEDNWEIYNERMDFKDWFSLGNSNSDYFNQNNRANEKKDGDKTNLKA